MPKLLSDAYGLRASFILSLRACIVEKLYPNIFVLFYSPRKLNAVPVLYTRTHTHIRQTNFILFLCFAHFHSSFLSFSSNLITHYNFALPFNQIFIVKEERQKKAKIRRHFGHFMRMDGAYTHCQNEYTPFTFVGQSNFLSSFSLPLLSRYIYKRIKVYKLTHLQRKIGVYASNFSQIRFIIKKIHKTIYLNKMFRKS